MVSFRYEEEKKELHCIFTGNLDSKNCPDIRKTVENKHIEIFGSKKLPKDLKIIFDLEKSEYVSSIFLRVIIMNAKKVKRGNFSIVKANPFVKQLLQTTGIDQLVNLESTEIDSWMREVRVFSPTELFKEKAHISSLDEYNRLHKQSIDEPESFWGDRAKEELEWFEPWTDVCQWELPYAKWFLNGKLNASFNCLDVHLNTEIADKVAILWEGERAEDGVAREEVSLTYRELHEEVCRFSNVLKNNNVEKGDRVLIYMPMVPEAVVAMLSCARIGAIHSVVFGGFSSHAIGERVKDCNAKVILTADGGYRKGKLLPLKDYVDESFELKDDNGEFLCSSIEKVIILKRAGCDIKFYPERDLWWHEELDKVDKNCPPEKMDSEDILFILYTSGSTGKPKGIYHSTAGYMLGCKLSHKYVFDIKDDDVYWCTADIGWITGHSYIVYGPLANGATVLMYEGAPNYPEKDRFWRIIEKYGVTIFYTAPTAIRSFMQWGDEWPNKHDLSSLRIIGTVGEPINPEAWIWYNEVIGKEKCPIVDTWWQTETGSMMITTLPGAMATKPGSAGKGLFGVDAKVVDDDGNEVAANKGGKLIITKPWPSMLRGIWGDPVRYEYTYWKDIPNKYFTGDSARKDEDGYLWIMGRIDDVLNVSGHRIGTAEVESAVVSHPSVVETAVVGRADDIKGSVVVAFVILASGVKPDDALRKDIGRQVAEEIGPVARPDEIRFCEALPKTRSGKIMRRLLKQIAAGTEITGDITTLEDFNVLAQLSGG